MFILKSIEKRMRRRTFIMAGKHISIPALLKIGAGALDNLGIYLKELQLQKVVVLFGNGLVESLVLPLWKHCSRRTLIF